MKKWLIFLLTWLLIGCKEKDIQTYFTPEKASGYFREIKEICDRDSGKLWGEHLYGPIMYIDRNTKKIITNFPDKEGLLKLKDGVYTGTYPKDLLINNAPVTYGGIVFAQTPLPVENDEFRIKTRAIHSLVHVLQQKNGVLESPFNATNMDEREARLWIKLEWKALRKALNSDGEERQLAIRDALIFRGSNREQYPRFAETENRFETYEGLATFSQIILCTGTTEEFKKRLFENLDRVYSMQSYSRSYGFIHGALYLSLLHNKGYDIRSITATDFDLGKEVQKLYNIELPVICRDVGGSLAVNYDMESILKEEAERDEFIKESIHDQASIFTEKPVVFIELESPYFDFEPEDIHSLDSLGTLYNSMRVSDNWGKLTVEKGGCLVSNNLRFLRVTAKSYKAEKNHISGEGWHMILNDDWELVPVEQNYFVRKLMP